MKIMAIQSAERGSFGAQVLVDGILFTVRLWPDGSWNYQALLPWCQHKGDGAGSNLDLTTHMTEIRKTLTPIFKLLVLTEDK